MMIIEWVDGEAITRQATDEEIASMPSEVVQVPSQVTMRQARLALLAISKLNGVDGAINSLQSPDKEAALIEWEYAKDVERNSPIVSMMGAALDLSEEDLDQLFIDASAL